MPLPHLSLVTPSRTFNRTQHTLNTHSSWSAVQLTTPPAEVCSESRMQQCKAQHKGNPTQQLCQPFSKRQTYTYIVCTSQKTNPTMLPCAAIPM